MPYVSVQVVKTISEKTTFDPELFSILSPNQTVGTPVNFTCAPPCFQTSILYPGGTAFGWLPALTNQNDPAPLLVFDNLIAFKLVGENGSLPAPLPPSGSNAIGYANHGQLHNNFELSQAGPVNTLALTPDGQFLLSAGGDKTIHVWDLSAGKEFLTLTGHTGRVRQIAMSPDGTRMASISADSDLILWDTSNWAALKTIPLKSPGLGVRFIPGGLLLSVDTAGNILVWMAETGQLVKEEHVPRTMDPSCADAPVQSFDATADGTVEAASLACGYGIIWKQGNAQVLMADSNHFTDLHRSAPTSSVITLSPDGQMAAYGMVYDPAHTLLLMDLLDVDNQKVIASVNPMDYNLASAVIAPGKDLLLAGVGNSLNVWWPEASVWANQNMTRLDGHLTRITALAFSTNGEMLASGDFLGKIILWSAK